MHIVGAFNFTRRNDAVAMEYDARSLAQRSRKFFNGGFAFGFKPDRFRVSGPHRNANGRRAQTQVRQAQHLARFFANLAFLTGIAGFVDGTDLRNNIPCEFTREDARRRFPGAFNDGAFAGQKLVEAGTSCTARRLIRSYAN